MSNQNLTLLTDFYELTMMQGYYNTKNNETVVFDLFYRENPSGSGYAICAGLEQTIDYIKALSFQDDDLEYLRTLKIFSEDFLTYLKDFHFFKIDLTEYLRLTKLSLPWDNNYH